MHRKIVILIATLTSLFVVSCSDQGTNNEPSRFGWIEGHITNIETKESIYGADLSLTNDTDHTPLMHGTTDNDGNYRFDRLDRGTYILMINKKGYQPETILIEVTSNQKANGDKQLTPEIVISAKGTVKADAQPLSDAQVYLIPTNNRTKVEVSNGTDQNGEFLFVGLPLNETYKLFVFKNGYKSISEREVTIPDNTVNIQMISETTGNISFDKTFIDMGEVTDMAVLGIQTGTTNNMSWKLTSDAPWLSFDTTQGCGNTSVIVEIDRKYLSGKNSERCAKIIVTSLDGSNDEAWVIVSGAGNGVNVGNLITLPIREITSNSAKVSCIFLNEHILKNAKQAGVCYSTINTIPAFEEDYSKAIAIDSIDNEGVFTISLKELTADQTYYVRAYVIDKETNQFHYSPNIRTFHTANQIIQPKLLVSEPTELHSSSAILNITVLNTGTPSYDELGFCYSKKTGEPTIYDTKTSIKTTDTTEYSLLIEGLEYHTTYRIKAYAIQQGIPVYSDNTVEFTTSWTNAQVRTMTPVNIKATQVTLQGTVISPGDPEYEERGFCFNRTGSPTIADKIAVPKTEHLDYSLTISDLTYSTTYYVCSYFLQHGKIIYGDILTFKTTWEDARIQTYVVTDIEAHSATFNGKINHIGDPECSEYGFVYSTTTPSPTISDNKVTFYNHTTTYNKSVTGLIADKMYYVRAYVIQPGNINPIYGETQTFKTGIPPEIQTVQINTVEKINQANGSYLLFATLNGKIIHPGTPTYAERGFVYKVEDIVLGTPPVYENDIVVKSPIEGNFTTITQQLKPMEWYTVRAYVKMPSGTIYYGNPEQFDTWKYTEY